jgi:hypothetical protein
VALMSLLTIAASVYRTNLQAEVVDVHYRWSWSCPIESDCNVSVTVVSAREKQAMYSEYITDAVNLNSRSRHTLPKSHHPPASYIPIFDSAGRTIVAKVADDRLVMMLYVLHCDSLVFCKRMANNERKFALESWLPPPNQETIVLTSRVTGAEKWVRRATLTLTSQLTGAFVGLSMLSFCLFRSASIIPSCVSV